MENGRERSKRETFMEEKEQLHYPEWIEALKEEEDYFVFLLEANGPRSLKCVLNNYLTVKKYIEIHEGQTKQENYELKE